MGSRPRRARGFNAGVEGHLAASWAQSVDGLRAYELWKAGNWIREHRGIYRLALFPATDRPDLALWSLWSSNRKEEVEGAYSHQTAISLFNLSDLNPAKLHMTVPRSFRRNSQIPSILVLHYEDLPA